MSAAEGGLRAFRQRESLLVLLNFSLAGVLLVVHVAFEGLLGPVRVGLVTILSVFLLLQIAVLVWLRGLRHVPAPRVLRGYEIASVWSTIGFAHAASALRQSVDSPFPVLMLPGVIAAGFRFGLRGTLAAVAVSSFLVFYEPWAFYRDHPPGVAGEYFEGVTLALMIVVVGLASYMLAGRLRRDAEDLRASLDELRTTRDKLIAEEKLGAVGRFASSIAHEIRNPASVISSSLATAMRTTTAPETREHMIAIATREAARLQTLTQDFLTYARPRLPQKKATDLAMTIGYVGELARAKAADSGASVAMAPVPPKALVDIDGFQVQQALLNLVLNAIEATPSGGVVTIGAECRSGGGWELFVENTGEALPENVVSRIFEPFFTTKATGTGLGLAIARNVARAHGGELGLAVNEPGRVRFTITLRESAEERIGVAGGELAANPDRR